MNKSGVSPDGEWVIATRAVTAEGADQPGERVETIAIPIRGGSPQLICAFDCMANSGWSPDGASMHLSAGGGRTMVIPVAQGKPLPEFPPGGLRSHADGLTLPGARLIEEPLVIAALGASTYVFQKTEIRRNLFRLQLR